MEVSRHAQIHPCIDMHLARAFDTEDVCIAGSETFHLEERFDTTDAFHSKGALIACANRVISIEVYYYGPSANMQPLSGGTPFS